MKAAASNDAEQRLQAIQEKRWNIVGIIVGS
jgi:hypothetical protein